MFNISSSYNRENPINNIHFSLSFSAFVRLFCPSLFRGYSLQAQNHCVLPGLACRTFPSVPPGMTGKKYLQQINGINRDSSGGGQSSAGMAASLGRGQALLQVPPPLSPTDRTAAFPLSRDTPCWEAHEGLTQATAASVALCAREHRPLSPTLGVPGRITRHTQPVPTWLSQCPSGTALHLLPHLLKLLCFLTLAMFEITWARAEGLQVPRAVTLLPSQQEHPALLINSQTNKSQERGRTPTASCVFLAAIQL